MQELGPVIAKELFYGSLKVVLFTPIILVLVFYGLLFGFLDSKQPFNKIRVFLNQFIFNEK